MISKKLSEILEISKEIKQFFTDINNFKDYELTIKKLNLKEIQRLLDEYPKLLEFDISTKLNSNKKKKNLSVIPQIICLTLVKIDLDNKNIAKLKKIKFYIDELNGNIIKFLQN